MQHFYTNERNHQILISLLKFHDVKNIVVSPGTTNSVFVGSIQNDPFFKIYSCVDERSSSYIACGIALETNEPVVISCTGATAARNYMSGATEAFYSKLPILILTSSQPNRNIGHLCAQVTDRTSPPNDTCKISIELPICNSKDDEWFCEIQANKALTELRRHGGGPVHLNLITTYCYSERNALTRQVLPVARGITRITKEDASLPKLGGTRFAVYVGSHKKWSSDLVSSVENFCETNNAVVLCDHTSNYNGKYKILFPLVINQALLNEKGDGAYNVDVLIHIGEVSGEEGSARMIKSKETWRVSEDGEIRDHFKNLTFVFEMSEKSFFAAYSKKDRIETSFYQECLAQYDSYYTVLPEQINRMPFSNVWIAQKIANSIPENSTVVLSILNTLRVWNYAKFHETVSVFSPVGGFGIDGATSMLIGASLCDADKMYYCMTGDLAFFYDINSLGNRHIGNNVRILLVNNGMGFEFKKCYAMAYRLLQDEVDPYVAAQGHFGNKSRGLVKHFAEDLGFEYISASNKTEFENVFRKFTDADNRDRPIIFECFVDPSDESTALNIVHNRK